MVNDGILESFIFSLSLFLIYINDLSEGLSTNTKLFANDTFSCSVIHDLQSSALNKGLRLIHGLTIQ